MNCPICDSSLIEYDYRPQYYLNWIPRRGCVNCFLYTADDRNEWFTPVEYWKNPKYFILVTRDNDHFIRVRVRKLERQSEHGTKINISRDKLVKMTKQKTLSTLITFL